MADLYERLKRFKKNTTQTSKSESDASPPSISSTPSNPVVDNPALAKIPGLARARDLIGAAEKREKEKERFLETIGVEKSENDYGAYGIREVLYSLDEFSYPKSDITGSELALQFRDESFSGLGARDLLFFDTETTGLAGGTGTVPFLVGVGFFDDGCFRVRQFVMRDFDEEPAVLHEIRCLLERFHAVASYNGKCFDAPILHSRFLLNRHKSNILNLPHADFLFVARRFWREILPNCTLLTVENYLTGVAREDDIPGEQIPYVYFDFLRGLRMQRMRPVLNHNAEDVRTLALIASRVCRMLRLPMPDPMHGLEIAAAGRCFAAVSDWDRACWYLEKSIEMGNLPDVNRLPICKNLSVLYKRIMRFEEACLLWQRMVREFEDSYAYIELAKHYEHKEKDVLQALHYTDIALEIVRGVSTSIARESQSKNGLIQQLLYRRERLLRKSDRSKEST